MNQREGIIFNLIRGGTKDVDFALDLTSTIDEILAEAEDSLTDLQEAMIEGRVMVYDERGRSLGEARYVLTFRTKIMLAMPGSEYSHHTAGEEIVKYWSSQEDFSLGVFHEDHRQNTLQIEKEYKEPVFKFNEPGWAFVKTRTWNDFVFYPKPTFDEVSYTLILW